MHIALVDPSRAIRAAIARPLELRGHVIKGFADPCAALRAIKADPTIDGVITSAELTSMSGIEVCWEVRLLASGRRAIYVLLISSSDDHRTLIEALDSGADDYISKPPHLEELFAKVRAGERIVKLQRDLIRLATTDSLTGFYNRRAFFERATEMCGGEETADHLSAILFDIDHFKQVNDRHGHYAGDQAIQAIASELERDQRIVGRLGGDEFCVLEACDLSRAREIAEDLRRRFSALSIATPDGVVTVSCSIGVSERRSGDSVDDLIKRADLALYHAKHEGRNRVAIAPTDDWIERNPRKRDTIARAEPR